MTTFLLGAIPQWGRAADPDDVSALARQFLVDANLGDLDKLAPLGRPQDAGSIPKPQTEEGSEMMKMKDLPELGEIRKELAAEIPSAFALGQPVFSADGKSATVPINPIKDQARKYFELKAVYNAFLGDAYLLKKDGKPLPTLDDVRGRVLAPDSPQLKWIDAKVANFAGDTPPLNFEKSADGWHINLQKLFGSKQ